MGRCSYNFVLYHHGGMITDGVMLRLAEDKFWMAQADGELMKWYLAHAHEFDVTISDPNVWVTQVQGPRSMEVLRDVIDGDFPRSSGAILTSLLCQSPGKRSSSPVLVFPTNWAGSSTCGPKTMQRKLATASGRWARGMR